MKKKVLALIMAGTMALSMAACGNTQSQDTPKEPEKQESENILVLTNKPTSIKHKLENTLPRPRNVVEPAFIDLRNQVTELIKWW